MFLCLNFHSVAEGNPNIVCGVDCHKSTNPHQRAVSKVSTKLASARVARKASMVALRDCLLRMVSSRASCRALAVSNRAVSPS